MKTNPIVWQETRTVALGELICCAVMVGLFWLLGRGSAQVLLGAAMGALLATGNFFVMALGASLALDRGGEAGNGPLLVQLSYLGRMVVLFLVLALCAKSGKFHPIALVAPLVFVRPVLTIRELILKKRSDAV